MTFKDIAIKNFKFNVKRYISYIGCSLFSITVLFIYSTLLYNKEIERAVKHTPIEGMINMIFGALVVFSFVFISYSYISFTKSRGKEFGLFLTLGMTKKDINRIIRVENSLIVIISLIVGLLIATVFSRVFFMIIVRILNIGIEGYALSYKSYILTSGVFFVSLLIILILTKFYIGKLEITDIIKVSRKGDIYKGYRPLLGILGLILLILSFLLMYFTFTGKISKRTGGMVSLYIIMCLVGLYLTISQFGNILIYFTKKNKEIYFRNIIGLTDISYRFRQYKNILYTITVLSATVVFFIGLCYGVYMGIPDMIKAEQPYDMMYIETNTRNNIPSAELDKILKSGDTKLTEKKHMEFLQMKIATRQKGQYRWWTRFIPIISDQILKEILEVDIDVSKGKAILWKTSDEVMSLSENEKSIKVSDEASGKAYDFQLQGEGSGAFINKSADSTHFIIIDNQDYQRVLKDISKSKVGEFHLFNFKDWKKTESIHDKLLEKILKVNNISTDKDKYQLRYAWKLRLNFVSKVVEYNAMLKENGFYLFIMIFIGLLFFISSGVVLYFKIYNDIEIGKKRYRKLLKVGITDIEMKKIISKELKFMFFIPLLMGSFIGIGYIAIMMMDISIYSELILNSIIVVAIYFLFQMVFYFITKKKYIAEVIE